MATTSKTKAEQLYNQCLRAYEKCRGGTGSTYNNMPAPSMFNDEYNVPAELLFEELRKSNDKWGKERNAFSWRLVEWVYARKIWDLDSFSEMRKKTLPRNEYVIYVEIFYRCEDYKRRPFAGPITIDGSRIEWCSKREYSIKYEEYRQEEQGDRDSSESTYLVKVPDYKKARHFPDIRSSDEKFVHPLKITVESTGSYSATVVALEKLELILNSLNVTQGSQKFSMRFFGGSENKLGSKTVFVTTGHYLVCGDGGLETYTSDDRIACVPKNKYEPSRQNIQLFRKILKSVIKDSIVRDRIECVLRDLALAYDSTNAGIKILNYWRCLEHAT